MARNSKFIVIFLILLATLLLSYGCKKSNSLILENTTDDELNDNYRGVVGDLNELNGEDYEAGIKLGISYPLVGDDQEREFTLQHLKTLNANLIRNSIHWKFREPERGKFNWKGDDDRIDFFNDNGISLLLTIESNGPDWACSSLNNEQSCVYNNEEDFRNFISAFLTRYKGKIDKIQFGNEWDNNFWYVGTAEEFTIFNNILYEETKKIDPNVQVVLGGITIVWPFSIAGCEGTLDSIQTNDNYYCNPELTTCVGEFRNIPEDCQTEETLDILERVNYVLENANYDIVDIHLYDDVENWPIYYGAIKNKVSKPIIVTEFGGPYVDNCNADYSSCGLGPAETADQYSDDYHAERVEKYIKMLNELGIKEAYYFKLVESDSSTLHHRKSGLIDRNLEEKPAYFVFKEFIDLTSR